MLASGQLEVISDFFLDSAKIIFGSIVVGVFVPGAAERIPWLTFAVGLGITTVFVSVSVMLSGTPKRESS